MHTAFDNNSQSHIPTDTLDLRKAFNCVPHDKLLANVWSVDMAGTLWKWVKWYLVDLNWCPLIISTQTFYQSLLGSHKAVSLVPYILFLMYVNDLFTYMSTSILSFSSLMTASVF